MTEHSNGSRRLVRSMAGPGIALLVINGMIGAGIFALPASVVAHAGDVSPWLFLVIGSLFLTVVLAFAELASYFNTSGGPVRYATAAFGPIIGFSTGWLCYVSRMVSFAANVTAMAVYVGAMLPVFQGSGAQKLLIVIVCCGLGVANYRGVRDGVRTIAAFTFLKLTPLFLIILLGLKEVTGDVLLPSSLPDVEEFGGMTLLVIYAFLGFEAGTFVSGETRSPERSVPRALVFAVLATAALYFLVVLVYVAVIPEGERAGATLTEVGRRLMGEPGAVLLGLAAIFSIGGNLASAMLSVPRMSFALGELRMLPAWFSVVHPRYATPANSVALLTALSLLFALSGSFEFLAVSASLLRLLTYGVCLAALPRVRAQATDAQRAVAFTPPGNRLLPWVGLVLCAWIASHSPSGAWLVSAALLVAGLLLYVIANRSAVTRAR